MTLNRYSYAVNNPVMLNDPSGHMPNWVKKAANWVNNKVIQPTVSAVKSAASWVSEKVIQPVKKAATSAANWVGTNVIQPKVETEKQKLKTVAQKIQTGYQTIRSSATQFYRQSKTYIQQCTTEVKQKVIKFSCGVAEKISNAWESAKDTISNIDWARVGEGALEVIGGVIVIGVGVAAVVATDGLAAPAFAALLEGTATLTDLCILGTTIFGGLSIMNGSADTAEGMQNFGYGLAGDSQSMSYHPVRDGLFNGNSDLYYLYEATLAHGANLGTQAIYQNRDYVEATVGGKKIMAPEAPAAEETLEEVSGNDSNGEAHNVVKYAQYKEILRTTEQANPLVESLKKTGQLPENYITKEEAEASGWKSGKALNNYVPGAQIGGNEYRNDTHILPEKTGRIWYEADVGLSNTMSRSKQPGTRLLYSNDGLLYVTYDHYETVHPIGNWK